MRQSDRLDALGLDVAEHAVDFIAGCGRGPLEVEVVHLGRLAATFVPFGCSAWLVGICEVSVDHLGRYM